MGLDYFRSATGKARAKSWNGAHSFLKQPDLFGVQIVEQNRTVTASLHSQCTVELGTALVVRVVEQSLIVCDKFTEIGRIDDPSEAILKAVEAQCGLALATVERLGMFGNMELSLQ